MPIDFISSSRLSLSADAVYPYQQMPLYPYQQMPFILISSCRLSLSADAAERASRNHACEGGEDGDDQLDDASPFAGRYDSTHFYIPFLSESCPYTKKG